MKNLADTSELLDITIFKLMENPGSFNTEEGIGILDQWIKPLDEADSTKPLGSELGKLKDLLEHKPVNNEAVVSQMGIVADQLLLLAPKIGTEGEMPSLLMALAAALRFGGGAVKTN